MISRVGQRTWVSGCSVLLPTYHFISSENCFPVRPTLPSSTLMPRSSMTFSTLNPRSNASSARFTISGETSPSIARASNVSAVMRAPWRQLFCFHVAQHCSSPMPLSSRNLRLGYAFVPAGSSQPRQKARCLRPDACEFQKECAWGWLQPTRCRQPQGLPTPGNLGMLSLGSGIWGQPDTAPHWMARAQCTMRDGPQISGLECPKNGAERSTRRRTDMYSWKSRVPELSTSASAVIM